MNIKTKSTYAEPEFAEINFADWLQIIRAESEKHGIHPVLCADHVRLLNAKR